MEPLKYKLQELNDKKPEDQFKQLGVNQELPFSIERTHTGNLPVYRKYANNPNYKRTVIRHVTGDIDAFN